MLFVCWLVNQGMHVEHSLSPEATAVYIEELDKLTRAVTDKAVALMQAGGRKVLTREDAKEAFRTTAATGDDAPVMEPSALFRPLDRMPPAQVFEVVRLIQEWLASRIASRTFPGAGVRGSTAP